MARAFLTDEIPPGGLAGRIERCLIVLKAQQ
jgi:hypothetical protein